jgi:sugar lactone lactonase YvrE
MMMVRWIVCLVMSAVHALVLAQAGPPAHDGGAYTPHGASRVAEWEPGTFLESIAIAPNGNVYVANHEAGAVDVVRDGRIERLAKLPGSITGLLLRPQGGLLATGRSKGGPESVYAIDAEGGITVLSTVPGAGFLNGMTWLTERHVLIADSDAGVIWRLDVSARRVDAWVRGDLLDHESPQTHFPANTGFPAANGIKRHRDAVYVSNSGRGMILRIPIVRGDRAGAIGIYAKNIVTDDFVIDAAGTIFAPTHPLQTVVRLSSDGTRTTIATVKEGITGPTAVALAPEGALYVVGNAGIPVDGAKRASALIRLAASTRTASATGGLKQVESPNYITQTLAPVGDPESARVIAVVSSIPLAVDLARYDLAAAAFAPNIIIDYTSLWGGEPQHMTPGALMDAWRGLVPGFDATRHELRDVQTTVTGETATASAFVDGRHWLGGALWRPVGTYHWSLRKLDGRWKVETMTFAMTQEIGDRDLVAIATERARKGGR